MDSEVKILHRDIEKYYYDVSVPYEVARLLPNDSEDCISIIQCLNESLNLLDLRKPYSEALSEPDAGTEVSYGRIL
jgi:alpha-mannosidase